MTRRRIDLQAEARRPLDHAAAVELARLNLDRLEERRLAALDGAGRAPDPKVIAAAEYALAAAVAKAGGVLA